MLYCFFWRQAFLHEYGEMLKNGGGTRDIIQLVEGVLDVGAF